MESQCSIDITNFIKTKNHLNHFLSIFAFFSTLWCIYFWHKYIPTSHHIRFKIVVSLEFDLFGFWPTIICKNIVKILHNMWPQKNSIVWQQIWPPIVLSPFNNTLLKLKITKQCKLVDNCCLKKKTCESWSWYLH
jgi:hypothetical protein